MRKGVDAEVKGRLDSPPRSTSRACGELVVALGLGDSVLSNLIEQCLVADLQYRRRLLAVPIRLFQRAGDGLGFCAVFGIACQRLQSASTVSGFRRRLATGASGPVIPGLK